MEKRNEYSFLKTKLFFTLVLKGKMSFGKLFNTAQSVIAYAFKWKRSSAMPILLNLELGNECNINCLFCRNESGTIHNINNHKPEAGIAKGKMPMDMVKDIIYQSRNHALVSVLYTNGEPLLYHDLSKVIKYATDLKMATVIASNGLLLTERVSKEILEAGLDLIKIQLSGWTNDIYRIQTRIGDVEKWKKNVERFVQLKNEGNHKIVILIDFIYYKYNAHQLPLVREFCNRLGLTLNIRPGNPKGGLEDKEGPLTEEELPLKESCAWIWQGMQVNWNGDVLPCCEAVVWGEPPVYEHYEVGKSNVATIWNSTEATTMRQTLSPKDGRGKVDMCAKCLRKGICFKW